MMHAKVDRTIEVEVEKPFRMILPQNGQHLKMTPCCSFSRYMNAHRRTNLICKIIHEFSISMHCFYKNKISEYFKGRYTLNSANLSILKYTRSNANHFFKVIGPTKVFTILSTHVYELLKLPCQLIVSTQYCFPDG